VRFPDVERFLDRSGPFLKAREAEHNLQLGVCSVLRIDPDAYDGPPYLTTVEADGAVVAVAMRTPPFQLLVSEVTDDRALPVLADALARDIPDLPGIQGPTAPAQRLAELWAARSGLRSRLATQERIFALTRVRPPRPVRGRLRDADPGDRELLIEWIAAFNREALGDTDTSDVPDLVDRVLTGRFRRMFLWDDGGPVSLAGAGGRTPNGIRIGPVYTPPELRGRGYASACVAAVSQAQLDAGRRFCFLFTDLANPTSNHIYHEIGYVPVIDIDRYTFEPPA